ncbi:MAG: hypothetical protein OHK0039_20870 [Bacteroidia bacterium]
MSAHPLSLTSQSAHAMLTLTQALPLEGYQVQATLRKREKNHPFIAVLMLAAEQGGWVEAETVHQELLPALPPKASQNLLERLKLQRYFEPNEEGFSLTELGFRSAQQQEIWVPMQGVFDLHLVDSPFVAQRVAGMELRPEIQDDDPKKQKRLPSKACPDYLQEFIGQRFQLDGEEYQLDDLEEKCFFLPKESAHLSLKADPKKGVEVWVEATQGQATFSSFQQEIPDFTYGDVRQQLLAQAFSSYDLDHDWLKVPFDSKQLDFERKVHLAEPTLQGQHFQPIGLPGVAHQPASEQDAQEWFEALLHLRLDRYFYTEEAFEEFQKTIEQDFRTHKPSYLNRAEMLAQLPAEPQHFYTRMKLLDPDAELIFSHPYYPLFPIQMKTTLTLSNETTLPLAILPAPVAFQPQEADGPLWETGPKRQVQSRLVDMIRQARQMICVQTFIMDDNPVVTALVEAADWGVAVFVTGATVKLSPPEEEPEFRTESYKKLLEDRFKGRMLFRAADHFHAKFVLIDPQTQQPQGVLLTANLTDKALSRNPELAVPLSQVQVQELYEQFRYHFWEEAQEEHTDRKEFVGVTPRAAFSLPLAGQVLFTQKQADKQPLRQYLLDAIKGAQRDICLSTYNLDPSHPVAQAILEKARAGVRVKLFFPEREQKIKAACAPFLESGAEVFIQPYLHAKALLIDGEIGFVFSANIQKYGLDQGWEAGLQLNAAQSSALAQRFAAWSTGFGQLRRELPITACTGQLRLLNGTLKSIEIHEQVVEATTHSVQNFQELSQKIAGCQAVPNVHRTLYELTFTFPAPPAKYEKKRELVPGLWEIERPGKKGKAPRPAWLIEGHLDWEGLQHQFDQSQLNWSVYGK